MPSAKPLMAANARKGDLAAIHVAKAKLGWSDDEYRDIMAAVCSGITSSAQLDFTGRKRFLAHLRTCLERQGGQPKATRQVRAELTPTQRKMWALWMRLADAGLVEHRTMVALSSYAQRQTGVQRIEWLNAQQEALVIDSMNAWLKSKQQGS